MGKRKKYKKQLFFLLDAWLNGHLHFRSVVAMYTKHRKHGYISRWFVRSLRTIILHSVYLASHAGVPQVQDVPKRPRQGQGKGRQVSCHVFEMLALCRKSKMNKNHKTCFTFLQHKVLLPINGRLRFKQSKAVYMCGDPQKKCTPASRT